MALIREAGPVDDLAMTAAEELHDVRDQLEVLVMRRNMGGWVPASQREFRRLADREGELIGHAVLDTAASR